MSNQVSCSNCGCKSLYGGSNPYACGNCGCRESSTHVVTDLSNIAAKVAGVEPSFLAENPRLASNSHLALRKSRKKKTYKPKKKTSKPKKNSLKKKRTSRPKERVLFDPDQVSVDIEEDMLRPLVEYSCRMELSLSVDFEGQVPKDRLIKKLKSEMMASIKAAVNIVSRDFSLETTGVKVQPIKLECAVNSDRL